jgi:hypothetical protein
MSEAAIRAAIYSVLSGVTGIGKVYDYERWTADWSTFLNLFKVVSAGKVHGWEIARVGYAKEIMTVGGSDDPTHHEYVIRGYYSVDDSAATEKTFNTLIASVLEAFRQNRTLSGAGYVDDIKGIVEARTFGGVLCHYTEMTLLCREQI